MKNFQDIVQANKITWDFRPLPQEEFEEWIEFYTVQMKALEFDILASVEKLNKFLEKGRQIFTFDIYLDGNLMGRKLITIKDGLATSCFKASNHISKIARKVSLGALLDYLMLEVLLKRKDILEISFGRSGNQFGVSFKIGYLSYKFRFGQLVKPAQVENVETVEINDEGYVFFYAFDESGEMKLYSFKPKMAAENYNMIKKITPNGLIELEL